MRWVLLVIFALAALLMVPWQMFLSPDGVGIRRVYNGGRAHRAGLQTGDVVLKVNGQPINSGSELNRCICAVIPNTEATITIKRGEKLVTLKVDVGDTYADPACQPSVLEGLF